nr:unnamed protein product [Callosobruchus chinensis]
MLMLIIFGDSHYENGEAITLIYLLICPHNIYAKSARTFDADVANSSLEVLGLEWNQSTDSFSFSVSFLERSYTKHNMLSELARINDPLGFLSPLTVFMKILAQKLWTTSLIWDDTRPVQVTRLWEEYKTQLPCLSKLEIPRHSVIAVKSYTHELHLFCDASEKAYAAVAYIRILLNDVHIATKFLCAKTKVAPSKN